ncbi:hypothetical protein [Pseudonocardia pini]|uniref:hypothetical protein n=1 Tax=Pseudonocardia pini TaxID=2758030 RepID=UPI0015F0BF0D|nr:hypothetical protein [Pseudonocardia pini]
MTRPEPPTTRIETSRAALATLEEVRDRAVRWLLDRVGPGGEPAFAAEHNGYYRLPWALALAGERGAAAEVLGWIEREALTADGDLREGTPRAAWTAMAATYPLTIIAHGAWTLERYDTARAVWEALVPLVDPDSGGAYWERPEARVTGRQLLFPTAQLGMTALHTGRTDVADAAYGWFTALLAAQPELPRRFHVSRDARGLVTDVPEADAYNLVVDFAQPRQAFHNPGIGAAFLARYGAATGRAEVVRTARELLHLHDGATEEQYRFTESTGVCKLGLGAAAVYDVAPDDGLCDHLLRMTAWYRDSQDPAGWWAQRTRLRPEPKEFHIVEKTAEHVVWVSMMITALAGKESA